MLVFKIKKEHQILQQHFTLIPMAKVFEPYCPWASFCRKTHVHKIPRFLGGFLGGGGSADFIFMGARVFLNVKKQREKIKEDPDKLHLVIF